MIVQNYAADAETASRTDEVFNTYFEDSGGWTLHTTPELKVFKLFVPYELAQDIWGVENCARNDVQAWMNRHHLRLHAMAVPLLGDDRVPARRFDPRFVVTEVEKGSDLFRIAMDERDKWNRPRVVNGRDIDPPRAGFVNSFCIPEDD